MTEKDEVRPGGQTRPRDRDEASDNTGETDIRAGSKSEVVESHSKSISILNHFTRAVWIVQNPSTIKSCLSKARERHKMPLFLLHVLYLGDYPN